MSWTNKLHLLIGESSHIVEPTIVEASAATRVRSATGLVPAALRDGVPRGMNHTE
jgi:hypothetical protein